jgi:hypothetical protein
MYLEGTGDVFLLQGQGKQLSLILAPVEVCSHQVIEIKISHIIVSIGRDLRKNSL